MSALQSALAELRSAATTSTLPHLPTPQSAALLDHIDRLTADLAEAREQVQAACCGPWHDREVSDTDAATFPWGRVKAAREVAARWYSHAHWQASQGPHEATVAWAVAQTVLSLVLDELDYDGIEPRNERAAGPAETRTCTGCDGTGQRRDFNTEGEFESVERCGGCDGTGRVASEDESCDEDAPTCRDCGTWPCARHATDADRAEHEQATESGAAR